MDSKQHIREFLRAHRGVSYSHTELAATINDYQHFDTPIKVNADEVLTYGLELSDEEERIKHHVSTGTVTATIDGERRTLVLDDGYLRYEIVAEFAPERLDEVEGLHQEALLEWIIDELVDDLESSVIEHYFEYEGRGWGGPD